MKQAERQNRIREIQSSNLSAAEKNDLIRRLLAEPSPSSLSKTLASNTSLICTHYNKKCSRFYFKCCRVIDPCHRCHLERCGVGKPLIEDIECSQCSKRQPPGPSCIYCQTKFSPSFCSKCLIWTEATIYHCHDCGICRVGTAETLFHCHTCDICFLKSDVERHICMKRKIREEKCLFCLENLFSSQQSSTVMKCGHASHRPCIERAVTSKIVSCPLCRKSICNMTSHWTFLKETILRNPMPRDWPLRRGHRLQSTYGQFVVTETSRSTNQIYEGYLVNWRLADGSFPKAIFHRNALSQVVEVEIFCNDCEGTAYTKYHELGLECVQCGSFNTIRK